MQLKNNLLRLRSSTKIHKTELNRALIDFEKLIRTYHIIREELRKRKDELLFVSAKCEQEIVDNQRKKLSNTDVLHQRLERKETEIMELKEFNEQLAIEVETLKREISAEHMCQKREYDARRILISDLNELKHQYTDLKTATLEEPGEKEDTTLLKLIIEQSKKAQSDLIREVDRLKTEYAEVVPFKSYTMLKELLASLVHESVVLKVQLNNTKSQLELEQIRHSIEVTTIPGQSEYLSPLGTSDQIPKFVRHDQPVKRRNIHLRDCLLLIDNLWAERRRDKMNVMQENVNDPVQATSFDDFVDAFFKTSFPADGQIRIEWAYTFYDALNTFANHPKANELKSIIDDEINESVHWHLWEWIGKVKLRLLEKALKEDAKLIDRDALRSILTSLLLDSEGGDEVQALIDGLVGAAIDKSVIGSTDNSIEQDVDKVVEDGADECRIEIDRLFILEPGSPISPFLHQLIELYRLVKSKYHAKLGDYIRQQKFKGPLTEKRFKEAVKSVNRSLVGDRTGRRHLFAPIRLESLGDEFVWLCKPLAVEPVAPSPKKKELKAKKKAIDTILERLSGANIFPPDLGESKK